MPVIARTALRRAVENIAHWGDTDLFPLPIENHVFHGMPDKVIDRLVEMASGFESELNSFPVVSYSTLAPVGYTGFRWADFAH